MSSMFYFEILEAHHKEGIAYLAVGGLAVNLHGVPRTTQDIDVIISTDRDNVEKLCVMLARLGYKPRLPVDPVEMSDPETRRDWIEKRNLKAFSFYHEKISYKVFDIVLDQPIRFEDAFKRRKTVQVSDITVNVMHIDDLITMKKGSGRPRDLSDVEMLEEAKKFQRL